MSFATYDVRRLVLDVTQLDASNVSGTGQTAPMAPTPAVGCLMSMVVENNDTIPHNLRIGLSPNNNIGSAVLTAIIPAGAGRNGIPTVDVLATALPLPAGMILLPTGTYLNWDVDEAIGASATVSVLTVLGYF